MFLDIIRVSGINEALTGLALNKLQPVENMEEVANKLCKANAGSHKKFLRMIQIWIKIQAPMYWWYEYDTYKVGVTRQSSSIMHKPLEHIKFSKYTLPEVIEAYKALLSKEGVTIQEIKANTPAGVMYESVVNLNYQVLQTIYKDRHNHRLEEWRYFCKRLEILSHFHWIKGERL